MGSVVGITTEGRDTSYFGARVDWALESDQICGVKESAEPKTTAVSK